MVDAVIMANMAREFARRRAQTAGRRPKAKRKNQARLRSGKWSAEELKQLRELYPAHRQREVAAVLGRNVQSVKSTITRLGLGERKYWSKDDIARLRVLYPAQSTKQVAAALGRSVSSVYGMAFNLDLGKTAEYLETVGIQKGSGIGAEFRFRKGQAPVNKGIRRPGYAPGRMRETQFKKGERNGLAAKNWRPLGTVLPDTEGFLRKKVREPLPGEAFGWGNKEAWAYLHRLVWQGHHGPIPEHHAAVFKDGNRSNCAIENLECIHRRELAQRNAMWNRYPRELTAAIQLSGVLKRKLRSLTHGEEQNV